MNEIGYTEERESKAESKFEAISRNTMISAEEGLKTATELRQRLGSALTKNQQLEKTAEGAPKSVAECEILGTVDDLREIIQRTNAILFDIHKRLVL